VNQRLAAIVESSDDAIISTDLRGTITSWNRGAEELYGYTREEAIGRNIELVLPMGRDEDGGIIERISRGERIEHYETVRRNKSGRLVEVSLTVSPLLDANGKPVGTSKIARDITEKKRQEAELRSQQKLYRAVGESIDFGIWVCDAAGRNVYASESFLRLVGMSQEECSDLGWVKALPPEQVDSIQEAWTECVKTGSVWERELLFKGAEGKWHPVLSRGVPIHDEDGRIAYWAGINLDIAAFKKTEAALRQNEQQLRLVTDNAIVFLAHCDRDYRLKFVNRPYARRFGRTPEEVIGKSISNLIGTAAFESFKAQLDQSLAGHRVEFEIEIPYEQFGKRWMRVVHEPERDAQGNVIGVVAVISDITARKIAEHDMEVARDKAEAASRAKDDFLAALSHELRTPLNPVLLLASEHASDSTLPDQVRADFQTIRKNVELEARLIDDLLDLTRITRGKLSLNLAVQDLHAVLQDAIATMRPDLEVKALTLTFELNAAQTKLWADAVRLQQVFWNVLKNAVKFTPEDGRILVRTRNDPAKSRVVIEVHDSGIGMNAMELARVFDAFSQGDHASAGGSHRFGGVGLGLTISRMLVELHRGSIRAESEGRDRGSTFTIELPIAEDLGEPEQRWVRPRGASAAPFSLGNDVADHRPRLLLVEDHEPTRVALAHLLARREFEVLQAPNVSSALAIAASGGIDLVVSDIGLPDGNGFELMQELKRRHGLRGIALTGYGMDHDILRGQAAGFVVHLTKPVTVHSLEKALRSAIAER
jgi:PAS domain S-box-containing protein